MVLLIAIVLNFITACHSQWTPVYDNPLPRADFYMTCGSFNDSIFIIGGWDNPLQMTQYKIYDNAMIDYGENALPFQIKGTGGYYIQLLNIIYMIDPNGDTLSIYNMETNTFTPNWSNIIIPVNVQEFSCLASSHEYLYIIGGSNNDNYLDIVQVLNLNTKQWFNISSMQDPRRSHGCIIVSDVLYVIGGKNSNGYLDSIETINISNKNAKWNYIDSLQEPASGIVCVSYQDMIWVFRGYDGSTYHDTFYIINTINNSVSMIPDPLPYAIHGVSAIIVNNILYAFGGLGDEFVNIDSWIKYQFPPTDSPTLNPTTKSPSELPTKSSSKSPTKLPTESPSKSPTMNPTSDPSNLPTNIPLNVPSTAFPISLSSTTYTTTYTTTMTAGDKEIEETTANTDDGGVNNMPNTSDNTSYVAVIVLVSIGAVCLIAILGYIIYKKYGKHNVENDIIIKKDAINNEDDIIITDNDGTNVEHIQMVNVKSHNETTSSSEVIGFDMINTAGNEGDTNTKSMEGEDNENENDIHDVDNYLMDDEIIDPMIETAMNDNKDLNEINDDNDMLNGVNETNIRSDNDNDNEIDDDNDILNVVNQTNIGPNNDNEIVNADNQTIR